MPSGQMCDITSPLAPSLYRHIENDPKNQENRYKLTFSWPFVRPWPFSACHLRRCAPCRFHDSRISARRPRSSRLVVACSWSRIRVDRVDGSRCGHAKADGSLLRAWKSAGSIRGRGRERVRATIHCHTPRERVKIECGGGDGVVWRWCVMASE